MKAVLRSFVSVALAAAVGCGGKVVVDSPVGAGGAGGAGGASSSTTNATTGSASTAVSSSAASSSVTSTTGAGGGPGDCSALGFNGIGAACGPEGASCRVPNACCQGTAVCKGGVWIATAQPCTGPCLPCGDGLACNAGSLCVEASFPQGSLYTDAYQCLAACSGIDACSCAVSVCPWEECSTVVGSSTATVLCN